MAMNGSIDMPVRVPPAYVPLVYNMLGEGQGSDRVAGHPAASLRAADLASGERPLPHRVFRFKLMEF